MRKNIFSAIALSAVLLTGCTNNSEENFAAETFSETDTILVTEISSVTTSVTSETVIFCEESDFEEMSAKVTETEMVTDKGIKITPANELYSVYPKRIIYPEQQPTNITAERAEIKEQFEKDGYAVDEFSAVFPVFSGGDEAVMKKINDGIRAYIDEAYEKSKKHTEEYDIENDTYVKAHFGFSMTIHGDGGRDGSGLAYDINGNILSVDFYTHDYAGGAHGAVIPVSLVFDLRTGDRVDLNNIFEDRAAAVNEINMAAYQYFKNRWSRGSVEGYESGFEDFYGLSDFYDETDLTVRNGCFTFRTSPYGFGGSFADGMQFMEVAAEDIYPYLNEAGKSLFEGYASAKSEPVNIIDKNGEKYFDID